jgi:hypothetical protein
MRTRFRGSTKQIWTTTSRNRGPRSCIGWCGEQLTEYVLHDVEDVLPYVAILDGPRLLDRVARDTL